MRDPALVVALANARSVRRPSGARDRELRDALGEASAATELLAPYLGRAVRPRELPPLRELERAVCAIVDALIDGRPAPIEMLNRLAAQHPAVSALQLCADGTLQQGVRFAHPSAAASLTGRVIGELADVDPLRLRRCARRECALVFYDRTRSATQRWHSDRPCGLRERQRRHRIKIATRDGA